MRELFKKYKVQSKREWTLGYHRWASETLSGVYQLEICDTYIRIYIRTGHMWSIIVAPARIKI